MGTILSAFTSLCLLHSSKIVLTYARIDTCWTFFCTLYQYTVDERTACKQLNITYLMYLAKEFANIRQKSPFIESFVRYSWAKDYRKKSKSVT